MILSLMILVGISDVVMVLMLLLTLDYDNTENVCFSSFISKGNLTKMLETIFQITRQTFGD